MLVAGAGAGASDAEASMALMVKKRRSGDRKFDVVLFGAGMGLDVLVSSNGNGMRMEVESFAGKLCSVELPVLLITEAAAD